MAKPLIFLALAFSAALAGCSAGGASKDRERPTPLVKVEPAMTMRFVDAIDAVGNAVANEQVTLAAPVTERLVRLNFDDGSYVRKGQVIAVLATGQENAQLAEAQARAREAGQQLSRISTLKARGFATKSNFDAQVAAAAAARAQASEVRASISDRIITAPFSGFASRRTISVGAIVNSGTEIATISDIGRIKLDFPVPETLLATVKRGQTIEAEAAAYPGVPFRGQVATIDPVLDPNTRAAMVRAILPNPDGRLKPGMLLTVKIETAPRLGVSVPEIAVVGEGDARYVYVVGPGSKVKRLAVKTGLRDAGRIEILEGLKAGERVVTEGVVKVSDGMKVRLAGPEAGARTPGGRAPGAR